MNPRRLVILLLLPGLSLPALAEETEPGSTGSGAMVDNVHSSVDDFVQNTVRRVDRFFGDSEVDTFAERKTRIRLRLDTDYAQAHGWEFSPRVKLHLVLPGLSDRLRLVVNDDQGSGADQDAPQSDDENDVALRWIGRQRDDQGYSFDLGVRIKDSDLDPFARINAGIDYPLGGSWTGQTTNRLYYYSKTGWRNDLRQYFNHPLAENLLFRSRTRLQYFEENDYNPFVEQKFSVFHSLTEDRKLAYEVLFRRVAEEDSLWDEDEIVNEPQERYDQVALQVRFRQRLWRPWFFVEFWPIVSWPEEQDYDTTLGARIRIEANLGGVGDSRLDE